MAIHYVETTIPSFYVETRTDVTMAARRQWTRSWWDELSSVDQLVSSAAVVDELQNGTFPGREDALKLMESVELLDIDEAVSEIVEAYIAHRLMPVDPFGDALHLAIASYHQCDFLVTWNCKHLANANKFDHIRRVNGILGLWVPSLVTPLELLGGSP